MNTQEKLQKHLEVVSYPGQDLVFVNTHSIAFLCTEIDDVRKEILKLRENPPPQNLFSGAKNA